MADDLTVARLRKEVDKWKSMAQRFKNEAHANERRAMKAEMVLRALLRETAPYMPTFALSGTMSSLQGAREMARALIEMSGEDLLEKVLDAIHDVWDAAQITVTDHHDKLRVESLRNALHRLKWKGRFP